MPVLTEKNIKNWLLEVIRPEELNDKDPKTAGILFEAIVSQSKIREVAEEYLSRGYFLESLTAVDFAECFEIVYHFNHWGSATSATKLADPSFGGNASTDKSADRSCVKILVPKESGAPSGAESRAESRGNQAPSISSIYKAADWFEREVYDMFGVKFLDHP